MISFIFMQTILPLESYRKL